MEAAAVACTAGRLAPAEVERAVALLASCRGKVVTVGVGKSGHIAQKAAATLTSTGTTAVFLHPSDALHGGMGLVGAGDVCVFVSNSGETAELLELLPYLQHKRAAVLAVVGNTASALARRADVVLDASVEQEACPLNLAPTTSTTVALAVGDALAMALMGVKRLTPEDFAMNHPGGRLGKRLTLRVSDLMHDGEGNPTAAANASLLEVVQAQEADRAAVLFDDGEDCYLPRAILHKFERLVREHVGRDDDGPARHHVARRKLREV